MLKKQRHGQGMILTCNTRVVRIFLNFVCVRACVYVCSFYVIISFKGEYIGCENPQRFVDCCTCVLKCQLKR